jgi:predicted HicB family RNase H-like nuclease
MSDDLSDAAQRGRDKQGPRGLSDELSSDDSSDDGNEKEPTTRFTVDLPDSLHKQFKVAAAEDDQSMKELMITALEQYLRQR